jgi:hypothetical protein
MSKLIYLNLCVLSFCAILFASDASFDDDNERFLSSVNYATEEEILKKIQVEAPTMNKSRAVWVFLDASYTGKLSVVKFLREHFDEKILDKKDMYDALQWASVGGWLETTKYFMTSPKKTMLDQAGVNDALVNAAWQGHLTVVEYMMTLSEGLVPNLDGIEEAIKAAKGEQRKNVLDYFHQIISKELVLALEECGGSDSEDSENAESICAIQ